MTAILQLPLLDVSVETAANEDWRDGVMFAAAGQAVAYPAPTNTGNGYVSNPEVQAGAWIGDYLAVFTGASTYQVRDPDGLLLGAGLVGVPWQRSGLNFNLLAGATPFVAGDTFAVSVLPQPIDITGLEFEMDVRFGSSATSYLYASTANGLLVNDGPSGVLGFAVPIALMKKLPPGDPVADVLAHGDGITRRCVKIAMAHSLGVTSPR